MRFVTMSDIRRGNETKQPRRHNAIEMNVDGQPNRRNTETDEVSVIARGRACVRTVQYRHSEVMRSFGRSHIQRCVRAAAAQAMYDPCYYVPHEAPWPPAPRSRPASAAPSDWSDAGGGHARAGRAAPRRQGERWEQAAVGRHKGSRTRHAHGQTLPGVRAGAGTNEQSLTEVLTVRCCWPNKHNTVQISTTLNVRIV